MSEGKLYPVEPTLDMLSEGMDVYGFEDCAEAEVLAIYTAMRNAAPDVKGSNECPRCKGKGRHVTGPIDCPAMTICKLCSESNVQGDFTDWATRLYNTAYHAGHHHTVEGCYTHVYPQDMDSYHGDAVLEWMEDNPLPECSVQVELNILLDDVRNATKFFQSVKSASDAGEDCTITGGWKDANEWLKSAALALGSALEEATDD